MTRDSQGQQARAACKSAFWQANLGLACLLTALAACSSQIPAPSGNAALDGFGSGDSSGLKDGVGLADGSTSAFEVSNTTCSCTGFTCGTPPGCSQPCGSCGDDELCNNYKCEPNPNCQCKATQCGVLPGCKKLCAFSCGAKEVCKANSCETATCSCAGVECGVPPGDGCTKSCGDCGPAQLCVSNVCAADPKCECKAGKCGVLPGCVDSCGVCKSGDVCKNNACVPPVDDCACTATVQCGPMQTKCNKSCGSCAINQFCEGAKCVTPKPGSLLQYGEPCGAGETCPKPPANAGVSEVKKYLNCLNTLCDTAFCSHGVCTKPCKISTDLVDNATGAAGADGIEDPGVASSDCTGSVDGVVGKVFRCVEENTAFQVKNNDTYALCQPGEDFQLCQHNSDCAIGEACRIFTVYGSLVSRCGTQIHDPQGGVAAAGSMPCNTDPQVGPVHLCANGFCTASGCADLCKDDSDCKALAGQCNKGSCTSNNKACTTDADCPKWVCTPNFKETPLDDTSFSVCQPVP